MTGLKKGLYENRFLSPEFQVYDHEGSWNCEMGAADYEKLAEAINGYLEMFQSEELVQGQNQQQAEAEGLPGQILL